MDATLELNKNKRQESSQQLYQKLQAQQLIIQHMGLSDAVNRTKTSPKRNMLTKLTISRRLILQYLNFIKEVHRERWS